MAEQDSQPTPDDKPKRRPASFNRKDVAEREFSGVALVLMSVFFCLAAAGWLLLR